MLITPDIDLGQPGHRQEKVFSHLDLKDWHYHVENAVICMSQISKKWQMLGP